MSKTREALNLVRMYIIGEALPNKEQALKAIDDALAEHEPSPANLTISGALGTTLTYQTSAAATESKIRSKLIELGWTPPDTSPQPREWQELSEKEIISAISIDQSYNWPYKADENTPSRIAKRIYTALRAKNGGSA